MSKNLLFSDWTYKRKPSKPFAEVEKQRTDAKSDYRKEPGLVSLHAPTLRAVVAVNMASRGLDSSVAVGKIGENYIAERVDSKGNIEVVLYDPSNGSFQAGILENSEETTFKQYILKDRGGKDGTALLMPVIAMEFDTKSDKEFFDCMEKIPNTDGTGGTLMDDDELSKIGAVLSDNIYVRMEQADTLKNGIKTTIGSAGIRPLTSLNLKQGRYAPDTVIAGTFRVLKPGTGTSKKTEKGKKRVDTADLTGKYAFSERAFTLEEKALIPTIEPWFIVPKEVISIAQHAKATTDSNLPMRNFMMRGSAGVGKTESARAIAAAFNLPYLSLTCSANTEIFDLLGQILPDVEGMDGDSGKSEAKNTGKDSKSKGFAPKVPTLEDIQIDPASAYQKLTGVYDEDITEDAVYQEMLNVIHASAKKEVEESLNPPGASDKVETGQRFRYVETNLVRAMKYGYVIEIQEPSVIANPGVLVGLNSLLDNCKQITLPTGETITRHPDTVVVVTTNNDYAGCRNVNQSVISRMNLVLDIDEPTEAEMVSRVKSLTGVEDEDDIELMVSVVKAIQIRCREAMITDGVCGMRELISWVQSYAITEDMAESAGYTILSSVSADPESREEIKNTCVSPKVA